MYKKAIVINDQHLPFLDKKANQSVFTFIKDFKPDYIDILGDLIDFWQISKFRKDPTRKEDIQKDIDLGKEYLTELRDLAPQAEITLHFGNHLCRLRKFIWDKAKEIASLRSLDLTWLLNCDGLKIKSIDREEGYILRSNLVLTHGTIVSQDSAMTARRMLKKFGLSVIHGHTHRLGAVFETNLLGMRGAWENGCLCDLDLIKEWGHEIANWQVGCSTIFFKEGHKFLVQQIPIINGRFLYGDREFGD